MVRLSSFLGGGFSGNVARTFDDPGVFPAGSNN